MEDITMEFNGAVQAMLDGEKVTRVNGIGHDYIMLNDAGDVVGADDVLYGISKKDFIGDWAIVDTPAAGALLKRYGKFYRLIKETGDTYAILNAETFVEQAKGIAEKDLIRDLMYYDFDTVKTHKIN